MFHSLLFPFLFFGERTTPAPQSYRTVKGHQKPLFKPCLHPQEMCLILALWPPWAALSPKFSFHNKGREPQADRKATRQRRIVTLHFWPALKHWTNSLYWVFFPPTKHLWWLMSLQPQGAELSPLAATTTGGLHRVLLEWDLSVRDKAIPGFIYLGIEGWGREESALSRVGIFLEKIPKGSGVCTCGGLWPCRGGDSRPHWCHMRNCLPPVGSCNAHSSNCWPMEATILQEKNWKAKPNCAQFNQFIRVWLWGHRPSGSTKRPQDCRAPAQRENMEMIIRKWLSSGCLFLENQWICM